MTLQSIGVTHQMKACLLCTEGLQQQAPLIAVCFGFS